jgi:phosphoribosylaminoimidazolecarboxamide formyltransferase/IMP cyclohydrolase/phosphoribosylaminoimidazolecarboxamide formyltransferase
MSQIVLKYGCNPNQTYAKVILPDPAPLKVVNGSPSYINLLDGLRGWQLVRDLKQATGLASAASYKHVSPAGAAVEEKIDATFCKAHFYDVDPASLSPVASAYARARSSDRSASFGDFVAVSETVDVSLAQLLKTEVSDGIIAPGYQPEALSILQSKKGGKYVALQIDPSYEPPTIETRTEFGLTLEQLHNNVMVSPTTFDNIATKNKHIDADAMTTLIVTTLTLKHTQSNSIAVGVKGHSIGIGAGQQSRIACTRIACDKAERWLMKSHPRALALRYVDGLPKAEKVNVADGFVRWHELNDAERAEVCRGLSYTPEPIPTEARKQWLAQLPGVVLSSDAFIPFRDNLDRAAASGVKVVAQAGGSARDEDVIAAADQHGMVMALTGLRLFLH